MLVTRKYLVDLIEWKVSALENQLAELNVKILQEDEGDEQKKQYDALHDRFRAALDLMRDVVLTTSPSEVQLNSWYEQYQKI